MPMTDESESGCGPISGDELRRVKQLCRMRLAETAETTGGYGYTRPFTRRDVVLLYRIVVELMRREEAE